MMPKFLKHALTIPLCISLILTGCWDKVELENRGFVNSIGIDKYTHNKAAIEFKGKEAASNNRFTVSMSLPSLDTLLGQGGGGDTKSKSVKLASNETVSAAMRLIDSSSSQKIYFGHTKVAVLGSDLLKDEGLFRETIDALERNREISRKIIVLSSDGNASAILQGDVKGEPLLGMFVSNFYKNNSSSVALAFRQDLESLIRDLRSTNCTVVPKVALENDEIKLSGAAIIKDYKLAGWLDDEETRGYIWVRADAKGAQVTTPYEDFYIPLRVNRAKTKIHFSEENGKIMCYIDVKIKGSIEEFIFSNEALLDNEKLEYLEGEYEKIIAQEITNISDIFQKEYAMDGLGLMEELRKKSNDIYVKIKDDEPAAFQNMVVAPRVDVNITSTGSTK